MRARVAGEGDVNENQSQERSVEMREEACVGAELIW